MRDCVTDVLREREYQDEKWGGADHDDNYETEDNFVAYIVEYSSGLGRASKYDFRTRMVKTAALALAAIERHDRIAARGKESV